MSDSTPNPISSKPRITAKAISDLLGGRWQRTGYQAKCPCHDDQHANMSISTGADGQVLMTCRAGCDTSQILEKLKITHEQIGPLSASCKPSRTEKVIIEPGGTIEEFQSLEEKASQRSATLPPRPETIIADARPSKLLSVRELLALPPVSFVAGGQLVVGGSTSFTGLAAAANHLSHWTMHCALLPAGR